MQSNLSMITVFAYNSLLHLSRKECEFIFRGLKILTVKFGFRSADLEMRDKASSNNLIRFAFMILSDDESFLLVCKKARLYFFADQMEIGKVKFKRSHVFTSLFTPLQRVEVST